MPDDEMSKIVAEMSFMFVLLMMLLFIVDI